VIRHAARASSAPGRPCAALASVSRRSRGEVTGSDAAQASGTADGERDHREMLRRSLQHVRGQSRQPALRQHYSRTTAALHLKPVDRCQQF
jgi:hypothetical protein